MRPVVPAGLFDALPELEGLVLRIIGHVTCRWQGVTRTTTD